MDTNGFPRQERRSEWLLTVWNWTESWVQILWLSWEKFSITRVYKPLKRSFWFFLESIGGLILVCLSICRKRIQISIFNFLVFWEFSKVWKNSWISRWSNQFVNKLWRKNLSVLNVETLLYNLKNFRRTENPNFLKPVKYRQTFKS